MKAKIKMKKKKKMRIFIIMKKTKMMKNLLKRNKRKLKIFQTKKIWK